MAPLREILKREGICESFSAEQEGIFFAFEGRDEVSLQYHTSEHERVLLGDAAARKAKNDVLRCCSVLADHGFAITLVISPRTLALFVRSEAESETIGSPPYS